MTIRVGILGYGNLGRGVECAVKHNPDMELAAVYKKGSWQPDHPDRGGKGFICRGRAFHEG